MESLPGRRLFVYWIRFTFPTLRKGYKPIRTSCLVA